MPENIYGMEECKMSAWARDKTFPHQQGAFPFPELQLSRGELHFFFKPLKELHFD
jgi:hypothetical protein